MTINNSLYSTERCMLFLHYIWAIKLINKSLVFKSLVLKCAAVESPRLTISEKNVVSGTSSLFCEAGVFETPGWWEEKNTDIFQHVFQ